MHKKNYFFLLTITLILFTLISGCTVNRISLLTSEQTNTPIQPSYVKIYPTFKEISTPCQLEGMISAYTLPIAANSSEKRETLIKNTAAELGVNA